MTGYLDRVPDYHLPAVASALDELSLWSARFGLLLLEHVPLARGRTVLDLGCGTGFPLLELAQMLGPSCHLVGVDVWEAGLDRAAHKRAIYGLANVTLVAIDGTTLPFAAGHFDLIVANLVLNNLAQPEVLLAECARVAKPGACLALTTNPRGHMREFYDVYRDVVVACSHARYLDRLVAEEERRGTVDSARRLIRAGGVRRHEGGRGADLPALPGWRRPARARPDQGWLPGGMAVGRRYAGRAGRLRGPGAGARRTRSLVRRVGDDGPDALPGSHTPLAGRVVVRDGRGHLNGVVGRPPGAYPSER